MFVPLQNIIFTFMLPCMYLCHYITLSLHLCYLACVFAFISWHGASHGQKKRLRNQPGPGWKGLSTQAPADFERVSSGRGMHRVTGYINLSFVVPIVPLRENVHLPTHFFSHVFPFPGMPGNLHTQRPP